MVVNFNPAISFKSDTNLIAAKMNNNQKPQTVIPPDSFTQSTEVRFPDSWETTEDSQKKNEKVSKSLEKITAGLEEDEKEHKIKPNNTTTKTDKSEVEIFNENLNNRKWKKEYLPESDLIFITQKKVKDGVEYILEKDGTIRKVGKNTEPVIVIEANNEYAKEFNKIKSKNTHKENKPTLWYRFKDSIADVWKSLSVLSTMTVATAKGTLMAAATALGVLAAATILRSPRALKDGVKFVDILKRPMKIAGRTGKILAGISAGLVLLSNIVVAKLQANENTAIIEHKFKVDHREKIA